MKLTSRVILIFLMMVCATLLKASLLHAYSNVVINSVTTSSLEGPVHHGIVIETNGIIDPNLTSYEIQIKPDVPGPLPTWAIYSTKIQPYDARLINVPYRNGVLALRNDLTYCVRVRALYADTLTSWAQQCGLRLPTITSAESDDDSDTLPTPREYAMGLDPFDPDSDRDGFLDGLELASGRDPLHPNVPNIMMRSPSVVDFGIGSPTGANRNQHQFIELENTGDEVANVSSITVRSSAGDPLESVYHVGNFRRAISHIPPENRVLIPVSFIPSQRGEQSALMTVQFSNSEPRVFTLHGRGANIPDCQVTPDHLNFGDIAVNDQEVAVRDVMISNRPPVGDTRAPNEDNTPWSFVVSTTNTALAPGLRGFRLARGEELRLPVVFPHTAAGNYDSSIEIRSFPCGVQRITISAQAH